ncbi:transport protein avl9 domain-containing protein [Ditylenchus destructor]|nr:transport protein avl9 domain-containing protein [Ditylenchus destructor]
MKSDDLILHICVVGFHHKFGYQLEYCYPPIGEYKDSASGAIELPPLWANLPALALPDGAHNVESDSIFFILPSLAEHNRTVYRQIPADDLIEKDEQVTRSSVQKSVCVLSKVPLYGVLTTKLELITQAYFNEKNFSKVDVLIQMHRNLCDLFNSDYLDNQTIYAGLISLFPGMLEEGLNEAATYSVLRSTNPIVESRNVTESDGNEESAISTDSISIELVQANNPSSFNTNEYGFPLSIFTKGSIFHPYLGIDSMDMLRSDNIRAYCIGVTNSLFIQRLETVDATVTLNDKQEGQINILCPELKRELSLTKQDLRFMDFILKTMEMNANTSGSDDWIRSQFHEYLVALLSSATSNLKESIVEFNEEFMESLRTKHNYRVWSCSNHPGFSDTSAKHPFSGQLSMNDVLLQVNHTITGTQQGRKVISTFSNTSKYVTDTGSRFKASLFSWVKGGNANSNANNIDEAKAVEEDSPQNP